MTNEEMKAKHESLTCMDDACSMMVENSYAYAPDPYLPPSMLSTNKYVD